MTEERPAAYKTVVCRNCGCVLGVGAHGATDCEINRYHVRPSSIEAGACLRCGSVDVRPSNVANLVSVLSGGGGEYDDDEEIEFVRCANCGLIANGTK